MVGRDQRWPIGVDRRLVEEPSALTNPNNAKATWLQNAHAELDAAVAAVNGWPKDIAEDEFLAKLLALNLERPPA